MATNSFNNGEYGLDYNTRLGYGTDQGWLLQQEINNRKGENPFSSRSTCGRSSRSNSSAPVVAANPYAPQDSCMMPHGQPPTVGMQHSAPAVPYQHAPPAQMQPPPAMPQHSAPAAPASFSTPAQYGQAGPPLATPAYHPPYAAPSASAPQPQQPQQPPRPQQPQQPQAPPVATVAAAAPLATPSKVGGGRIVHSFNPGACGTPIQKSISLNVLSNASGGSEVGASPAAAGAAAGATAALLNPGGSSSPIHKSASYPAGFSQQPAPAAAHPASNGFNGFQHTSGSSAPPPAGLSPFAQQQPPQHRSPTNGTHTPLPATYTPPGASSPRDAMRPLAAAAAPPPRCATASPAAHTPSPLQQSSPYTVAPSAAASASPYASPPPPHTTGDTLRCAAQPQPASLGSVPHVAAAAAPRQAAAPQPARPSLAAPPVSGMASLSLQQPHQMQRPALPAANVPPFSYAPPTAPPQAQPQQGGVPPEVSRATSAPTQAPQPGDPATLGYGTDQGRWLEEYRRQQQAPGAAQQSANPFRQPAPAAPAPVQPPAPAAWQALQTAEGYTYYYNATTGESTWEMPAAMMGGGY